MKFHRSLLLTGLLFTALFLMPGTAAAKDQWIQVKSKNFVLIGNASEKDIRRVGTRLEQFRETFRSLFATANLTSSKPTNVIVFKSASSYKPFKPLRADGKADTGIAGYFQPGEDVNYITLSTEGSEKDTFGTIFHEYVHFILDTNYERSDVPVWFNEGLAEYYQTFEITDDISVKLGLFQEGHLYLLQQSKLMPLDQLFNATSRQVHGTGGHSRSIFYAQSWALMHYLIQGGQTKALGEFLDRLRKGMAPEQAFEQSFRTTYKQMESDLKKYVSARSYKYSEVRFKNKLSFDTEMQVSVLDDASSNAYLGDLLYRSNRPDDAELFLNNALKAEPGNAMANIALAMVKYRQNKLHEARNLLEKAIAGNPKSHLAYYRYAYLLTREGQNGSGFVMNFAPETAAKMRAALKKAIELKPDFPESYELLAFVAMVTGEGLDEAVSDLERALKLQPGNQRYALRVAEIYARQEKYSDARSIAEKIARTADNDEVRQRAEFVLSALDQRVQFERQAAARNIVSTTGEVLGEDPGPPRLARRRISESEAAKISIHKELRPVVAGESRVLGRIQKIDCTRSPIVYTISAGGAAFTLTSKDFEGLSVGSFDASLGTKQVGCDADLSAINSVITYSGVSSASGRKGELISIEFVPADFRLMTDEELDRVEKAAASDAVPDEREQLQIMFDSMKGLVRTPAAGEKRGFGQLETIDCKGQAMVFLFKTAGGAVRIAASRQPQIRVFSQDRSSLSFGCGIKPVEYPAVFVYTDRPDTKAKTSGELVALDLMQKGFVLD